MRLNSENNFSTTCLVKADLLFVLTDKKTSGIGIVENVLESIQKSFWAFPVVCSPTGIQIEYQSIYRGMQNSNIKKLFSKFSRLAYFNSKSLEILMQDSNSNFIHFIQGDISFGAGHYYKTFFAFPSEEDSVYSFENVSPLIYQTGIPYRLDLNSMTYIKSYDRLHSSSSVPQCIAAVSNSYYKGSPGDNPFQYGEWLTPLWVSDDDS